MAKLTEWKTIQERLLKPDFSGFVPIGSPRLIESAGSVTYEATGVFQNWLDENLNGRVYPKKLWESQLAEGSNFAKSLKERGVLGMIEHPDDGITRLDEVSHVVTDVWFATESEIASSKGLLKEGDILGRMEVLPTPQGQVLRALIEAKVKWGVSSRGSGSTMKVEGKKHVEVCDDFILETWDAVFNPSVARAIPNLIKEVRASNTVSESIKVLISDKPEVEKPSPTVLMVESTKYGKTTLDADKDGKFAFVGIDIGPFNSISEAVEAFVAHVKPAASEKPTVGESVEHPTPTTKNMSKLKEAKSLKAQALSLSRTEVKGMKPSERASFFESIDDMRINGATLLSEDASIRPLIEDVEKALAAFSKRLDEDEDMAPPPPGGAPPPPPGGDAPPPPEGEDAADDEVGGGAAEKLIGFADILRAAAEGGLDTEEALRIADELEGVADTIEGGVCEVTDDEPFADDIAAEPTTLPESKRVIGRLQRRLKINENRTKALNAATEKLLETQRKGNSSNRRGGEEDGLYEDAARQLAQKYNDDMTAIGRQLTKVTQPELYEAHKDEFEKEKNYRKFEDLVEKRLSERKAQLREAAEKKKPGTTENLNEDKTKKPGETPPAPPEELSESVTLRRALRGK